MHITDIYIQCLLKKGLYTGACFRQAGCQQSQSLVAPGLPPVRESPPRTLQSPPHIPARPRSRTPPMRSLHACNDDTTLSILATTALKITIHLPSY